MDVAVHQLFHLADAELRAHCILGQQDGEGQERMLEGSVLVVTVAVEDERGARRQLFKTVDYGSLLVTLKGFSQLVVQI